MIKPIAGKLKICGIFFTMAAALLTADVCRADATLATWSVVANAIIPDGLPDSGLLSSIIVSTNDSQFSGIDGPIVSQLMDIQLKVTGGWNGDYVVTLYHILPDNSVQSIVLINRIGQDGTHPDGFMNSGFDNVTLEENQPDIHTYGGSYSDATPLTGAYEPDGGANFDAFIGTTAAGTWSLYFTDDSPGDVGTLVDWSIALNVEPVPEPNSLAIFAALAVVGKFISRKFNRR